VRRRRTAALSGPAAELQGYADECAAAAEQGDRQAAERLRAVLSWMDMLRVSGNDPDIGELFVAFARDDGPP
jgi:hypothetical protein